MTFKKIGKVGICLVSRTYLNLSYKFSESAILLLDVNGYNIKS